MSTVIRGNFDPLLMFSYVVKKSCAAKHLIFGSKICGRSRWTNPASFLCSWSRWGWARGQYVRWPKLPGHGVTLASYSILWNNSLQLIRNAIFLTFSVFRRLSWHFQSTFSNIDLTRQFWFHLVSGQSYPIWPKVTPMNIVALRKRYCAAAILPNRDGLLLNTCYHHLKVL